MTAENQDIPMGDRKTKQPKSVVVYFIWWLSTVLWVANPFIMMCYFEATQRLGWYPPEADSIAIPIIGSFISAVVLYPLFFYLCLKATRSVVRPFGFFSWNRSRPLKSLIITIVFGALAALSIQSVIHGYHLDLEIQSSNLEEMSEIGKYRMAFSSGWVVLWLTLRGCFLPQDPNSKQLPLPQEGHK